MLNKVHKKMKASLSSNCPLSKSSAQAEYKLAQKRYRKTVRLCRVQQDVSHDTILHSILSQDPSSLYGYLRACKNGTPTTIQKLTVGDKVYEGEQVADGFFDSMSSLKACDMKHLENDQNLSDHFSNYEHIMKLCQDKREIPEITLVKARSILARIKKNVNDFYSITALHYINAGEDGVTHFSCLLNAIILDVNNASIDELNTALGLILYKGHRKEKTSDRSYRTISTCPFLAKSLDLYLRDLYHKCWDELKPNIKVLVVAMSLLPS